MRKLKAFWRRARFALLLGIVIFVIIVLGVTLVFAGMWPLYQMGTVDSDSLAKLPLFLFAVVSLVMGAVFSLLFGHLMLIRIRKIMAATKQIADGDYSVRLRMRGPEAFRQLSDSFNHMAEELGSVELLRSDFVNNFSHEFKTPIVSIRGFSNMLKREDLTPEERNEYLDIIIGELERLTELATNVLNLSKIEGQSILTDKKTFNVTEQIRLIIALLDSKWASKQIAFVFDCGEMFVTGNEELLKQVWINLLDNAIKFSPDGGTVEIQIHASAETLAASVSDQGPGISDEAAVHIFDKFYQGDTSHAAKGNGLGLTIVKRIVELHQGTVSMSHGQNGGTVFLVTLPCG